MKQAEFQDSIVWLKDMEYCAVDQDGEVYQFEAEPEFIKTSKGFMFFACVCKNHTFTGDLREIKDVENWLFKKTGELTW